MAVPLFSLLPIPSGFYIEVGEEHHGPFNDIIIGTEWRVRPRRGTLITRATLALCGSDGLITEKLVKAIPIDRLQPHTHKGHHVCDLEQVYARTHTFWDYQVLLLLWAA